MGLEIIYLNRASEIEKKLKEYSDRGDTIVNACRPLSGDDAWEGCYLRGIHYASLRYTQDVDERAICQRDRILRHWEQYDARKIVLVSNEEILEAFNIELLRRGLAEKVREVCEKFGAEETIEKYSKLWLNMPYLPHS